MVSLWFTILKVTLISIFVILTIRVMHFQPPFLYGSQKILTIYSLEKNTFTVFSFCFAKYQICVTSYKNFIAFHNHTKRYFHLVNNLVIWNVPLSCPQHRDLKSDSHKRFGNRDFACWAYILDYGESKKDCLN